MYFEISELCYMFVELYIFDHCRAIKERVFNNQKQMELPVPDLYFHRQETRQESYMGKGIVVREDSEMLIFSFLIYYYMTKSVKSIPEILSNFKNLH
jgi:hypothetical protein